MIFHPNLLTSFFRISNTRINIQQPIFFAKSLLEKFAIFAQLAPDARIFPISKRIIRLFRPISTFSSQNEHIRRFCEFRQKILKFELFFLKRMRYLEQIRLQKPPRDRAHFLRSQTLQPLYPELGQIVLSLLQERIQCQQSSPATK